MFNVASFVPLSVLEEELDLARLEKRLRRLNPREAILLCVKLNLLTSNRFGPSRSARQIKALELMSNGGLLEHADCQKLIAYMNDREAGGRSGLVFNRPQLFEMIRWLSVYAESTQEGNLPLFRHLRKDFLRSALACAELYGMREIATTLKSGVSFSENERTFLVGTRRGGVWGGSKLDALITIGRTDLLLKQHFFESNPSLEVHFSNTTGLTIQEWIDCSIALILVGLDYFDAADNSSDLAQLFEWRPDLVCSLTPSLIEPFRRYMKILAQSMKQLQAGFGSCSLTGDQVFRFRHLRARPILQLEGDRAIILDRNLFLESVSFGPMFLLVQTLGSEEPFERYGDAFQNYAFQLLCSTNSRLVSIGFGCDHIENEPAGEPMPINDIVLAKKKVCVLIEAKGVWLNDNALLSDDVEQFRSEILKKYGCSSSSSSKKKSKGIGQLAKVIVGLHEQTVRGVNGSEFVNSCEEVIPVLAVHDALMSDPGMCRFLANEFAMLLQVDFGDNSSIQLGRITVHNLIVLNYFDFEALDSIKLEKSIPELLMEYSHSNPTRRRAFRSFLEDCDVDAHVADEQLVRGRALRLLDDLQEAFKSQ